MFCTQCGKESTNTDRFCGGCGHELGGGSADPASIRVPQPASIVSSDVDWRASTDINEIFNHPEVQRQIAQVSGKNAAWITADQFFKLAQPIMSASGAGAVKLDTIAEIAVPIYARLGIKSKSELQKGFKSTMGETLAAAFCALAARGFELEDVQPAANGYLIEAKVPATMFSWTGHLLMTFEQHDEGVMVKTSLSVPGQAFDWGKGKSTLKKVFEDMLTYREI